MTPLRAVRLAALVLCCVSTVAHAQFAIDKTEMFLNPGDSSTRGGVLMVRNEGAERAQANLKLPAKLSTLSHPSRLSNPQPRLSFMLIPRS